MASTSTAPSPIGWICQGCKSQYGYSGFGRSRFWLHVLSWFASCYLLSQNTTTHQSVSNEIGVNSAGCSLRMCITSLVLDACKLSCNVEIHLQSKYMSIPFADLLGIGRWAHVCRGLCLALDLFSFLLLCMSRA